MEGGKICAINWFYSLNFLSYLIKSLIEIEISKTEIPG